VHLAHSLLLFGAPVSQSCSREDLLHLPLFLVLAKDLPLPMHMHSPASCAACWARCWQTQPPWLCGPLGECMVMLSSSWLSNVCCGQVKHL